MHEECFEDYFVKFQNCPICKKSMIHETKGLEKELDKQMESIPIPTEYKDVKVKILCNECCIESLVPFHLAGAKCPTCGSYNTSKIS